jgi:putative ABC transport system permease protein
MSVSEGVRIALRALAANKLRTALTMLGVIIGVGAVIALMSIGKGAQQQITERIRGMGTNLLFITPGSITQGGVRSGQGQAPTLTLEDALAIADPSNVPTVALVAPEITTGAQIAYGPTNTFTRIIGTTPEYQEVRNWRVAEGEFISRQHVDARSNVVVLGANVAQTLFGSDPEASPVGQTVRINRINFRVIGVMEAKGAQALGNQDDMALMPITTVATRFLRNRTTRGGTLVNQITVQVAEASAMEETVQRIGELLRQRHRVVQDDFVIRSQEDLLNTANQITGTLTVLLGSIAGISLVVGGIGIMNIMLVSVTERTREIGIRKAVGAKRRDILIQFLVESTLVSVLGGVVGIVLGIGVSRLIAGARIPGVAAGTAGLPSVVTPDAVLLAFGVSAAVGLFFGIYPASRAARLNPIEALRYE